VVTARLLYAAREYGRAAELLVGCVVWGEGDPATWALLVRSFANQGEMTRAGYACTAALLRHRTSAPLLYLRSVLLFQAERYADAASAARSALYLDRGLIMAYLTLGSARSRLGDRAGAERALLNAERLLAEMPGEQIVPASDEEPAGTLREMVRLQLRALGRAA
jgi:tetratricopeptide (TPR) repeat protein